MSTEHAVVFACGAEQLSGVLHEPAVPAPRGVLIIVGGPQYRVGSHRQFVLLARALAGQGVPVLRFDHRGVGDSDGETRAFTEIGPDIAAALDWFMQRLPVLREVVIWGLCDAASAALINVHRDARVAGLVLLNPWVRTPQLQSRTYLHSYYWRRLVDGSFWRGLLAGRVRILGSLREVAGHARESLATARPARPAQPGADFVAGMLEGLRKFHGPVLVILSGDDLVAEEFRLLCRRSRAWRSALDASRITRRELAAANHTCSRAEWRDQVAAWTAEWLRSW